MKARPIGIFDSGIGGISVYRQIRTQLPDENIVYLADQFNVPYGTKNLSKVYELAKQITEFLLLKKCKLIVIACNTACAAALHKLRKVYPEIIFVGMEPAVKPAALRSRSKAVGVLATEGTLKGKPYAGVLKRFAKDVEVYEQACFGLAEAIEGEKNEHYIKEMLIEWIEPLKDKNVDQLALACTHYPLILDLIKDVAGSSMTVIDPAEAIARRVESLLIQRNWLTSGSSEVEFYTTAQKHIQLPLIVKDEFKEISYCRWGEDQCLVEL